MDGNIASMQDVLVKGKEVLDKFANLKVEEIEKSFNTKIDEKLVELNKKLDSIIEAISTDTTAKTANNKQDEVTAYKSSIL
jgi:DNA primase large subunit